jgi:transcriptional regulator with XRE-family HTH domain
MLRKMSKRRPNLPIRVERALAKLGADIRTARKRRRIPVRVMAERALISPTTLTKIERGDPGTGIGFYASVLFVLDLSDRLGEIVDASTDALGLALSEQDLPERVRWPKRGGRTGAPTGSVSPSPSGDTK